MAVTSSRAPEETLRPPVRLAALVDDTDAFHGEVWGVTTAFLPSCFPAGLLTREGIRSRIGTGLPVLPCTGAVPEDTGAAPAYPATRIRTGQNSTFRLDRAEQHETWIADLLAGLGADLGTTVQATLVLGAPDPVRRAAFAPDTETDRTQARHVPEHLFVLQLDGQTSWNTTDPETDTVGQDPWATVTLKAGDALYLPPGRPYTATVRGGGSLHLLLTAERHSTRAVAARAVTGFLGATAAHAAPGTSPATARHARLAWLRAELTGYLPPSELAELLRTTQTAHDD